MASSPNNVAPARERTVPSFYNLAWRWHFYAGLFVIPFMILLSVTGIIYLFKPQLDAWMYADLMQVSAAYSPATASACPRASRAFKPSRCSPMTRATTPPCTSTSTAARYSPTCAGRTTAQWRGPWRAG